MMERKKRFYVYEEVKEGEINSVRERVLRRYMYEDFDGVKTQKQELDKQEVNKQEEELEDREVWKRRFDVFCEKLQFFKLLVLRGILFSCDIVFYNYNNLFYVLFCQFLYFLFYFILCIYKCSVIFSLFKQLVLFLCI